MFHPSLPSPRVRARLSRSRFRWAAARAAPLATHCCVVRRHRCRRRHRIPRMHVPASLPPLPRPPTDILHDSKRKRRRRSWMRRGRRRGARPTTLFNCTRARCGCLSVHAFFRSALASRFKCQESNAIRRAPLPAPLPPSIGHLQCHRARRRQRAPARPLALVM